jgi:hypothetical protein
VNINGPNLDASGNINLKGPNLKSPNINLEGPNIKSPDFNLSGNIPGIQVNAPKIDMPSAKVNVKGPNINSPSFNLSGNINGINSNDKDFFLTGIIPSFKYKNSNVEMKNYKINPDIKFSTIDPNISIKNLNNNNIKTSLNVSRGGSPGKRNFHGNLNDPNYLDIGEIKGSRRALIPTQYDINIPKKKNLQISGEKIIDEKDVILQPPFNINPNALMQGQIGPKPDRKSVHLTVSQMQIQPEQKTIEIQVPDEIIMERILGRYSCMTCGAGYHDKFQKPKVYGVCDKCGGTNFYRRVDDNRVTVQNRLVNYRKLTYPTIPYFEQKKLLKCVDGTGTIEATAKKIDDLLKVVSE